MEQRFWKIAYLVFQYVILLSLIGFLAWDYHLTGEPIQLILGILIGALYGIPVPEKWTYDEMHGIVRKSIEEYEKDRK